MLSVTGAGADECQPRLVFSTEAQRKVASRHVQEVERGDVHLSATRFTDVPNDVVKVQVTLRTAEVEDTSSQTEADVRASLNTADTALRAAFASSARGLKIEFQRQHVHARTEWDTSGRKPMRHWQGQSTYILTSESRDGNVADGLALGVLLVELVGSVQAHSRGQKIQTFLERDAPVHSLSSGSKERALDSLEEALVRELRTRADLWIRGMGMRRDSTRLKKVTVTREGTGFDSFSKQPDRRRSSDVIMAAAPAARLPADFSIGAGQTRVYMQAAAHFTALPPMVLAVSKATNVTEVDAMWKSTNVAEPERNTPTTPRKASTLCERSCARSAGPSARREAWRATCAPACRGDRATCDCKPPARASPPRRHSSDIKTERADGMAGGRTSG